MYIIKRYFFPPVKPFGKQMHHYYHQSKGNPKATQLGKKEGNLDWRSL